MPRVRTSSFILLWAGIAVHLFTVFIAVASTADWISAGLSFVFPVAAEVYWVIEAWHSTGVFLNILSLACFAYVAAWLTAFWTDPVMRGSPRLLLIEGGCTANTGGKSASDSKGMCNLRVIAG
jgi:hypothetical protein